KATIILRIPSSLGFPCDVLDSPASGHVCTIHTSNRNGESLQRRERPRDFSSANLLKCRRTIGTRRLRARDAPRRAADGGLPGVPFVNASLIVQPTTHPHQPGIAWFGNSSAR